MKKIALMVGVLTALVGTEAHAETDSDNFNPQTTFRPNEFPWESGEIDLLFDIGVNLRAAAYHEVDIEMLGQAEYDFDAQTLNFTGDMDGGLMENALGVEVTVEITFGGSAFEIGVYNIEETANGTFSPYLLPGDTERPFGVEEAIGPNDLVETTFTVPVIDIDVTLDVDWQLNIPGIEYQSTRILLTDGEDSVISNEVGVYDAEDDNLDLILPDVVPEETSTMYGTLEGTFDAEVAFIFIISAEVQGVDLGPFEVPLDYPVNEGIPVEFPVEVINFDVPAEPEPGTSTGEAADSSSGGDGESSGGDSDSDSDGTTTGDPIDPTVDDSASGSSGGGLPAAPDASNDGCGCTTNNEGGGFAWLFGLFGLSMLRRRRD
jgi:uncharacterized protein (TIGR03382 family)